MNAERRILANSALLGGVEVIGQALNLAMVVVLARAYGVSALGAYSFAMALGVVLATLATIGTTGYAIREIARDGSRTVALLATLGPVQAGAVLAGVAVLAAWAAISSGVPHGPAIAAVAASHLISRLGALYVAPLAAAEQFGRASWLGLLERVLGLGLFLLASSRGADFAGAAIALPVAALVSASLAWGSFRRHLPRHPPSAGAVRAIDALQASLPFFWTAVVATLYQRGGLLVLTAFAGTLAAGTYAAGERLLVPCAMLYGTFAAAAFPAFARLAGDPERLQEVVARCHRISLLVTLGLASLTALLGPRLVDLVWDHPVPGALTVLRVLALGVVLRSMSALLGAQCQALGAESDVAKVRILGLLGFVAMAIPATLFAGALGLAVATAISDLLLLAGLSAALRQRGHRPVSIAAAARPIAAAAAAAAIFLLLPAWPLPVQMAAAAGLLGVAMFVTGSVRLHDLRFLATLLRGRSPA
jgi:PST family polysaccharide transporter